MATKDNNKWKSSQLMSNRSYEINLHIDKDFKTVEMHSHDFFELYFFIRGSASYIVENGKYPLSPGDIMLISPNTLHQLDIKDSSATYERIVLWINPAFLRRLSSSQTYLGLCFDKASATGAYLVRNTAVAEKLSGELKKLYHLSSSPAFGNDIAAENTIRSVLLTLCNFYLAPSEFALKQGESTQLVTDAVDFINAHISEELSLERIAEYLFVSKYYFAHLFKEQTNTSPHRYILKKRLALSKSYLEGGVSIAEAAAKCGFQDYTHFFRAFKAEYNITPKQYHSLIKP